MELAALGMMQVVKPLRFLSLVSYSSAAAVAVGHVSFDVVAVVVDEVEDVVAD